MLKMKSSLVIILLCVSLCSSQTTENDFSTRILNAISHSKRKLELLRTEGKVPGLSVGVSYRGEELWTDGLGFADMETGAPCTSKSLHRIGSITKSISMVLTGKLLEEKRIDLDKPIYDYLGDAFPYKSFNGTEVNITLRQLVSHLGGIRHYFDSTEFYQKEGCGSRFDSLKYFKDDPLVASPGTDFHYSSFGFVTIGAVLQSVLNENETFESAMLDILRNELGMRETFFDEANEIILNRVKFYKVNEDDKLQIAPYIDASCRWPGGGMLSNVHDLLRFGNVMINSSKTDSGFLKSATVKSYWDKVVSTGTSDLFNFFYGMGWELLERKQSNCSDCRTVPFSLGMGHGGGSSGAIAYLLIVPEEEMVVALLTNVEPFPMNRQSAIDIMSMFIEHVNQIEYSDERSYGVAISNSKWLTMFTVIKTIWIFFL